MAVTTAQINDALTTTLGAAASLIRSQSYDELTEGMADTPTMQIYFEEWASDPTTTDDRHTFRGGGRVTEILYHVDVYVNQSANIGEDMARIAITVDEIIAILQSQNVKPYFGLDGIKAFRWRCVRAVFNYADADYRGVRFYLTIIVF